MSLATDIRNRYIREYRTEKFRLESDYKEDEQRKADYHGRELLELLQNVDDTAVNSDLETVDVLLEYKNNIFTVSNNGTMFTEETIERLCHGSASNKNDDFIGNKGTGFRSLLNWGKSIEIHSNGFHIGFSPEYADSEFEKISSEEIIFSQHQNVPNLTFPVLHCPYEAEPYDNGYDTTIRIVTSEEFQEDEQNILSQLESFDYKSLLFLPNITAITIDTDDYQMEISKISGEDGEVEIHVDERVERYLYFQNPNEPLVQYGKNESRKIKTSVAISLEEDSDYENDTMYCFFPIRNFPTQLNMLMHGTFDLSASRDDVNFGDINKTVLTHLLQFAIDIAQEQLVYQPDSLLAIKSLTPTNIQSKVWQKNGFDLLDFYLEEISKSSIIPTVNEDFISISEQPKLIKEQVPYFFRGDKFKQLIHYMPTTENDELLDLMAEHNGVDIVFSDVELAEVISSHLDDWSISEKVASFIWWEKNRASSSKLPKLLLNKNREYITENDRVYFIRGRHIEVPKWAKVNQLDSQFEEEFKSQATELEKISDEMGEDEILERVIQRNSGKNYSWQSTLFPHVKFLDADAASIISPINASVDGVFQQAIDFVVWLYSHYGHRSNWTPPSDVSFNLPAIDETVVRGSELYFGSDYQNPLADKLFKSQKMKPFATMSQLGIDIEDMVEFQDFSRKLDIKERPQLEYKKIDDRKFQSTFPEKLLESKMPGREPNERNPRVYSLEFNTISGMSEILKTLEIEEIIEWLSQDSELQEELDEKHAGVVTIQYAARERVYDRRVSFSVYNRSYIKYVFEDSKWLSIGGKKYKPNQCVFAYPGLDISAVVPTLTNVLLKELADRLKMKQRELRDFLVSVGVRESISQLDSNDFYRVLLQLPEKDQGGQISEKIYREIIDLSSIDHLGDSPNQQNFMDKGMVFTQNHDGRSYHLASDAYFSNSIEVNVGNYHLIKTPLRNGSFDVFSSVFGVLKFEENYSVVKESVVSHRENDRFQEDFSDFLVYARAWGEKNLRIKQQIDNIRVRLASQVLLEENDSRQAVETNYLLIQNKRGWLIYLAEDEELDNRQVSKCIEEMFAKIANVSNVEITNQLGELYRDVEGRKWLVEKVFGTVDVINQIAKNTIRTNLSEVLDLSYDSIELDSIDFNDFKNIGNSQPLIELLKAKQEDISTLETEGFEYSINLRPYFKEQGEKYLSSHEVEYKNRLFMEYSNKDFETKKTFLNEYARYRNFKIKLDDITNSVNFDVIKFVNSKFPLIEGKSESYNSKNSDLVYDRNFNKVLNQIEDNQIRDFNDFIDEHLELKSLIFFLDEQVSKYIKDEYHDYLNWSISDVGEEIRSMSSDETVAKVVAAPVSAVTPRQIESSTKPNFKPHTKSKIDKENQIKEINGKSAEKLVYNSLKQSIETLQWTSENSDIPSTRNTSSKYDMEYWSGGIKRYIEVKAATVTFFMSISEYEFAVANSENYELYLVDIKNEEILGPYAISKFEDSKVATQFQFAFERI